MEQIKRLAECICVIEENLKAKIMNKTDLSKGLAEVRSIGAAELMIGFCFGIVATLAAELVSGHRQ